jgi:tetratricopeptide (TPR) repeat protein
MRTTWKIWLQASAIAGLLLCLSGTAPAQTGQSSQSGQGSQSPPPAQSSDKSKSPDVTPLTLDAAPPVNAEEDAAFKAFQDVPPTDVNKRIEMAEGFNQKYPQSRYKPIVYSALTVAYMQTGQVQKIIETGEKAIELTPNDVTTLAILGQTIPRSINSTSADAAKQLQKAELYSKRAIEITPTLPKPATLSDAAFERAKNETLASAHSGLGLTYMQRGKSADAIPELEQAVKIDPSPDPVNYFLLGLANKNTSHFDDAIAAFNKCAASAGPMQARCKAQVDDTKKKSTTELSAPK